MSHLYVFCAAAGTVAYGVGVAVGRWAKKRELMDGIEGTEITLDQFRRLVRENEQLEREKRITENQLVISKRQEQESREQLVFTHNALMAAYGELDWRESKARAEEETAE